MSTYIQIQWTSASVEEAHDVCRSLVEAQLVACAHIIPGMTSIYLWNNHLETAEECKVLLKTRLELYDRVRELIEQKSRYEVSEILYNQIDGGNSSYLNWLDQTLARI